MKFIYTPEMFGHVGRIENDSTIVDAEAPPDMAPFRRDYDRPCRIRMGKPHEDAYALSCSSGRLLAQRNER